MNKGITKKEHDVLFSGEEKVGIFSNINVQDDKIVGVIHWEMSGFFGERAATVHCTRR